MGENVFNIRINNPSLLRETLLSDQSKRGEGEERSDEREIEREVGEKGGDEREVEREVGEEGGDEREVERGVDEERDDEREVESVDRESGVGRECEV